MDTDRLKDVVQTYNEGLHAIVFHQGAYHAGERRMRVGSRGIFRALRHFAGNHGWPQDALRPVVRRLDPWILKEAEQVATIVVAANLIEQALIVGVRQTAVAQMMRDRIPQALRVGVEVGHRPRVGGLPPLDRVLQQRLEPLPKVTGATCLALEDVMNGAQNMRQTLLLFDAVEGLGIVTAPPVRTSPPRNLGE